MRDGKEVAHDNPAARHKSERVLHCFVQTEANGIPGGLRGWFRSVTVREFRGKLRLRNRSFATFAGDYMTGTTKVVVA
jgi:hypothetical protein